MSRKPDTVLYTITVTKSGRYQVLFPHGTTFNGGSARNADKLARDHLRYRALNADDKPAKAAPPAKLSWCRNEPGSGSRTARHLQGLGIR
jgi:hypothetical protein